MSHFTVLVTAKNEDDLAARLQPYHEFECTGNNDQYIQEIDVTEEAKKEGLDYFGLEDRTVLSEAKINRNGKHKYGYAIVDSEDNIIKAIKRTNPNAKWDWWQIGGRWTGTLRLKRNRVQVQAAGNDNPGLMTPENVDYKMADYAPADEIDWDGMLTDWRNKQREWWSKHRYYYDLAVAKYPNCPQEAKDKAEKLWNDSGRRGELTHQTFGVLDTAIIFEHAELLAQNANQYWFLDWDEITKILMSQEEFEQTLTAKAQTYAFIDMDGNWQQRGEMGWWGMDDKSKGTDNYDLAWWDFVRSIPDNLVVYIVDCHI